MENAQPQMQRVPVRYVGAKQFKTDTVCGTLTVWRCAGDIQCVEPSVAAKLLRFPDVWVPGDADWAPPAADTSLAGIARPTEAMKALAEQADADEEDAEEPLEEPEAPAVDAGPATAEEVLAVLSQLDPAQDMTEQGRPKIAAVRALLPGRDVGVAAVSAAWAKFQGE